MRCYFLFFFICLVNCFSLSGQDLEAIQNELNSIKVRDIGEFGQNVTSINSHDPLFVIMADDKSLEVSNNRNSTDSVTLHQFNPEWIESITVLKGKDSIDKYGARGQNGAVLITLKKDILNRMPIEISRKFK